MLTERRTLRIWRSAAKQLETVFETLVLMDSLRRCRCPDLGRNVQASQRQTRQEVVDLAVALDDELFFNLFDVYTRNSMTFVNKQNNAKGHQVCNNKCPNKKKYNNTIIQFKNN